MASLNKVFLLGSLGRDVDFKTTAGGTSVASFSMATSEKVKDKDGTWSDRTEWHNVTLWAKNAEVARDYLSKGKMVLIEGRITTEKYQKDGRDVYSTKIVGERMQLLSPKSDSSQGAKPQDTGNSYQEPQFNPDDEIPF